MNDWRGGTTVYSQATGHRHQPAVVHRQIQESAFSAATRYTARTLAGYINVTPHVYLSAYGLTLISVQILALSPKVHLLL